MKVTVSVPGKIHLMGEHAVVHGAPALLTAIDRRMYVSASISGHTSNKDGVTVVSKESDEYVKKIITVIAHELRVDSLPHLEITIDSQIPSGYHLGSSAAIAVGLSGALLYLFKRIWNPTRINEIAYEAEKLQHGNPSGGDNTAVTFGGLVWYRKELDFLKSMWSLPFKPAPTLRHFSLIDTGRPVESTGDMVKALGERVTSDDQMYRRIFFNNETQTKRLTQALKIGNEQELIDAIRMGQKTLEDMDVVSDKAKKLIREIEESGGAAKILGGGGKKDGVGYLLAYHTDQRKLNSTLDLYNKTPIPIRLGEEGVRLEKHGKNYS